MLAWKLKCKGSTVYRDGSRSIQVLNIGKDEDKKDNFTASKAVMQTPKPRSRPENVSGATYKIGTGYGKLFVTVNNDEQGRPFEVFATIGKTGGVFAAKSEAICRLISLSLRCGIDPQILIEQLKGIRGPMPHWHKGKMVLSIPDAISQVLQEHINSSQQSLGLKFQDGGANEEEQLIKEISGEEARQLKESDKIPGVSVRVIRKEKPVTAVKNDLAKVDSGASLADLGMSPECPDCGGILELQEGCVLCRGCGYSKCG